MLDDKKERKKEKNEERKVGRKKEREKEKKNSWKGEGNQKNADYFHSPSSTKLISKLYLSNLTGIEKFWITKDLIKINSLI